MVGKWSRFELFLSLELDFEIEINARPGAEGSIENRQCRFLGVVELDNLSAFVNELLNTQIRVCIKQHQVNLLPSKQCPEAG